MEARKIIRFGNSSHVVSIPKSWIQENKLKKGDLVYLEKNSNGELILWPREKEEERNKKVVIEVNGKENRDIGREVIAAYIHGHDNITIKTSNVKQDLLDLKKNLKNLMGVEVLEKNSHEIVIANILDIKSISLADTLRRMDNNARSMLEDLEICLKNKKITQKQFSEIYETDYDINKFYFLFWRITISSLKEPHLLSKLKVDSVQLMNLWWLAMNLEKMSDELKRIARIFLETKLENDGDKLLKVFLSIKKAYLDAINSYHKKNISLAYSVASRKTDIIESCNEIIAKSRKPAISMIAERLKATQSEINHIAKCTIYFGQNEQD